MAVCPICKKEFEKEHHRQIYCGSDCASLAKKKQNIQYYHKNKESLEVKCSWCGEEFTTQDSKIKYCSDDCRYYARLDQVCRSKREFYRKYDSRKMQRIGIGSGWLSGHRHMSIEKERVAIEREMKRLRIH